MQYDRINKKRVSSFEEQSFIMDALDSLWKDSAREVGLTDEMTCLEKNRIIEAMHLCGGNKTHASQYLGIGRTLLIHKLKKYELT